MNLKIKAIAAAVALALGGTAAADPIGPEGIFFTAWNGNPDAPTSIIINLGYTTDDFLANPAEYTLTGDSLAALSSWLGGITDLSRVEWGVMGAMLGPSGSPTYGAISTVADLDPLGYHDWGLFTGLDATVENFSIFLTNPYAGNAQLVGTNAYAANNFEQQFNGIFNNDELSNIGSMGFYQLFASQEPGTEFNEGDYIQHGNWTLAFENGQASLAYSAVPLPAAGWLLLSSLLGLAGVARRKVAA